MDRKYKLACLTDSSAAKGISQRHGVGRPKHSKHLELKELWVQDKVVKKVELEVCKIGTDKNWSDLGTKALDGNRITQLVEMMPLKRCLVLASLFNKKRDEPKRGKVPTVSAGIPATTDQTGFLAGRSAGTAGSGVARSSSSCTAVPVATQASVEQPQLRQRREPDQPAPVPDPVWIIGSGERYHRSACGMVSVQPHRCVQIERQEAVQAEYAPYEQCGG